jgi:hypothetical protein
MLAHSKFALPFRHRHDAGVLLKKGFDQVVPRMFSGYFLFFFYSIICLGDCWPKGFRVYFFYAYFPPYYNHIVIDDLLAN